MKPLGERQAGLHQRLHQRDGSSSPSYVAVLPSRSLASPRGSPTLETSMCLSAEEEMETAALTAWGCCCPAPCPVPPGHHDLEGTCPGVKCHCSEWGGGKEGWDRKAERRDVLGRASKEELTYLHLPFCSTALVLPKVKPWWAQSSSITGSASLLCF